jgi:hypothetical protein
MPVSRERVGAHDDCFDFMVDERAQPIDEVLVHGLSSAARRSTRA